MPALSLPLERYISDPRLLPLADKVRREERLSFEDGLLLYESPDLTGIGAMAHWERLRRHGLKTYYVVSRRLSYTNICVTHCQFCAFEARPGDPKAYVLSAEQIVKEMEKPENAGVRELHMVAGHYPKLKIEYFEDLFRRLGPLGAQFMVHCEDDAIIAAVDPAGLDLRDAHSHTLLRPEQAEVEAIQRVVDLALTYRAALHVVHVSTAEGAEILVRNRPLGKLSFETCPQYLVLDDTWLQRPEGHHWLCSPPLRACRPRLRELARAGAADILATDHCAFRPEDKDDWDGKDLRTVANGLPGIGALPHLAWQLWEDDADRAALGLATHLALNPARRAGVQDRKGALTPGLDADIAVLDPAGPEQPLRSTLVPAFEAFPRVHSKLSFRHVLLRGEPRVRDGQLLDPGRPSGVPLQPATRSLTFR